MDVSWEDFGWERLGNGTGRRRLPVWDATAALVAGADGVLLYDTGSTLREGAALRTQAEALFGRRVTHVALSHPHFDHVLGTAAFAGAEVYGAVGTAELLGRHGAAGLRADAMRHGMSEEDATAATDVLVAPHHQVSGEWTLDLGGGLQVLLANVGPGHTGHDLAVLVPGSPSWSSAVIWSRSPASRRRPGRGPFPLAGRAGPAAGAGRRGRVVRAGARGGGGRRVRTGAARPAGGPLRRVLSGSPSIVVPCAATSRT